MKVTVIAGGVGGARMALGFAGVVAAQDLDIIVNIGDDERFHGLYVCPDLDTVLYTLAGVVDRSQGWGVADDATRALDVLRRLDAPGTWMKLGDADLGLHIYRSLRLAQGASLTETMDQVRHGFGVACGLLPVSDEECPTEVVTQAGVLRFQEWFVRERGQPAVKALKFEAARKARMSERARHALLAADLVVIAPSNPFLSIQPILEVGGVRQALQASTAVKVAVSPLIGGRAIKGPLVKLMQDLGHDCSNADIASGYSGMVDYFVVDMADADQAAQVERSGGMQVLQLPILIPDAARAVSLARSIISKVGSVQ